MFRGAVKFRNHFAVSARGNLGNYDHNAVLLAGIVDLQVTLRYHSSQNFRAPHVHAPPSIRAHAGMRA